MKPKKKFDVAAWKEKRGLTSSWRYRPVTCDCADCKAYRRARAAVEPQVLLLAAEVAKTERRK